MIGKAMKLRFSHFLKKEKDNESQGEKETVYARLTFQFFDSLVGEVTPEIRAILFSIIQENNQRVLKIYFYHNREISEDQQENYRCLCTEGSYDDDGYPEYWNAFEVVPVRIDYPAPIPQQERLVYYRKEPQDLVGVQKYQSDFISPYVDLGKEYYGAHLRLVMQNALLGRVVPALRRIGMNWFDDHIFVHFYYHGDVKNEYQEDIDAVMTCFSKYFPSDYISVRSYRMDYLQEIPYHEVVPYSRKEQAIDKNFFSRPSPDASRKKP